MKVILAGMPKTGTKSVKKALTTLGYSVYDVEENFENLYEEWMKIMTVGGEVEDFRRMYEDVDATCDVPACYYWEEMHKAFPDAKILLMLRDSEEEWFKSMCNQLQVLSNCGLYSTVSRLSPHCARLQTFLNNAMWSPVEISSPRAIDMRILCLSALLHFNDFHVFLIRVAFGSVPISPWQTYTPNKQSLKIAYRNHNARVLQVAPKDKLLVYRCSEGWPKLCEFLGCQVPEEKFPHLNKQGEFVKEDMKENKPGLRLIKREITVSVCAIISVVGYLVYNSVKSSLLLF